jgi:hypothetical protein
MRQQHVSAQESSQRRGVWERSLAEKRAIQRHQESP